jgi:hypothetical protein
MISLAAGGGDYLFLVVMLVFGLINWLANKAKEGKAPPPRPNAPPRPSVPQSGDPEAERMRRFLEALGVPSDATEAPAPPVARTPMPRPAPVARRAAPPPLPAPDRSLDEADTTTEPVERIRLPELRTVEVPEFQTVSSRITADSGAEFVTVSSGISAVPTVAPLAEIVAAPRSSDALSVALRQALRSPTDLRAAFVLREVLGPPRSLQS